MSSSFRNLKREQEKDLWSFGPWYDHYLRQWGQCHPNYTSIPIGNSGESSVCIRRRDSKGRPLDHAREEERREQQERWGGYLKYRSDLYRPWRTVPIQEWNPSPYPHRRPPNQGWNTSRGYLRTPVQYNGTGLIPNRTPGGFSAPQDEYIEHAVHVLPEQPVRYQKNRAEQMYDSWREEQRLRHGVSEDYLVQVDRNPIRSTDRAEMDRTRSEGDYHPLSSRPVITGYYGHEHHLLPT